MYYKSTSNSFRGDILIPKYRISLELYENPLNYGDISIIQIGRMHCKPGNIIERHIHTDYFELTVVSDGDGTVMVNNSPIAVSAGDIVLSLPCDSHEIYSGFDNPLKYFFFAFSLKNSQFKESFENISQHYYAPNNRIIRNDNIPVLVGNTITELNNKSIYSDELISMYLQQTLILTIREFNKITNQNTPDFSKNSKALCYYVMNYIDTHIYALKNLNEISQILDYNYSYLSTIFKEHTGYTISEYYNDKKLSAAKSLIKENRLNITQISELLNYSSPFAFSNAFKKKYNYSPKIFREKYNQKSDD